MTKECDIERLAARLAARLEAGSIADRDAVLREFCREVTAKYGEQCFARVYCLRLLYESGREAGVEKGREMERDSNSVRVVWPWFIVGCVLLLVAIVAFFWAFALGDLTRGQYFLLLWLLPLASGFACGAFSGSIHAKTTSALAVTATGGFAVWVLSYYLLPTPP